MVARQGSRLVGVSYSHRKVPATCPCGMRITVCQAIARTARLRLTLPKPLDRRIRNRESDARRRQAKPWRGWYNTPRWRARRDGQLSEQPLCERCKAKGLVVEASVAHHVDRHNGNPDLFWHGKLASSCKDCHDSIEQAIEARGYEIGCDVSGRPVALDHPWNKRGA